MQKIQKTILDKDFEISLIPAMSAMKEFAKLAKIIGKSVNSFKGIKVNTESDLNDMPVSDQIVLFGNLLSSIDESDIEHIEKLVRKHSAVLNEAGDYSPLSPDKTFNETFDGNLDMWILVMKEVLQANFLDSIKRLKNQMKK